MSYLHLDRGSLVGDHMIPDVFINEVSLKVARGGEPYGKPGHTHRGRPTDKKSYTTREKLLQVDVKLSFKEVVGSDFASFWAVNSGMRQYVSINAILTTNKKMFNRLHTLSKTPSQKFNFENKSIMALLDANSQLRKVDVGAAVSLFRKQNNTNFVNCKIDLSDGSLLSEIPIHLSFNPIGDIDPESLMLIVYPYIELENVLTNSRKASARSKSISIGRVINKIIIKDKKVLKNGFVLKRQDNNKLYAGDYHVMRDGSLMAGSTHGSSRRQTPLYKESIRDTSIKDYRKFKKYFDATIARANTKRSIFPQKVVNSLANISLFEKKTSPFSDIWMSYDHAGRCKFAFAINMRNIILDNCRFSDFVIKNPRLATSHFDVLSMSVVRRRVFLKNNEIDGMKVIPSKANHALALSKKSEKFFNKAIGAADTKESAEIRDDVSTRVVSLADLNKKSVAADSNSLRSLDLGVSGDPTVNIYSVNDAKIAKINDGQYQYGVEVRIRDNVVSYLEQTIEDLVAAKSSMELYFTEASQPSLRVHGGKSPQRDPHVTSGANTDIDKTIKTFEKNYNISAKAFTYQYKRQIVEKYPGSATPWFYAAGTITTVLKDFFEIEGDDFDETYFITMCDPHTGSPEGILMTIKLIDKLISALKNTIGVSTIQASDQAKGPAPKNRLTGKKAGIGPLSSIKREFTIQHFFENEYFDAAVKKGAGYDYLLRAEDNFENIENSSVTMPGLKTVAASSFQRRVKQEREKYFTLNRDQASVKEGQGPITAQLHSFANTDYSYLSPSRVGLGDGPGISFLCAGLPSSTQTEDNQYPYVEITTMATQIMTLKSVKSIYKGEGDQTSKTNINLINFLGNKSVSLGSFVEKDSLASSNVKKEERQNAFGKENKLNFSNIFKSNTSVGLSRQIKDTDPLKELPVSDKLAVVLNSNNINKMLLRVSKNHIVSDNNTSISKITNNFSIDKFNLSIDTNVLQRACSTNQQENSLGSLSEIGSLPNQVKALFLSSIDSDNIINFSAFAKDGDVLKDSMKSFTYLFNFFSLMEIQYLAGFNKNEKYATVNKKISKLGMQNARTQPEIKISETAVNKSTWKPLTKEKIADAMLNKYELLCRMKKYENKLLGIGAVPGLELVNFDEFFVIRPLTTQKRVTNVSSVRNKKAKTMTTRALNRTYREISPEFILTAKDLLEGSE